MNNKRLAYVCLEEFQGAFNAQTACGGRQKNGFAGTKHEARAVSLGDDAGSAKSDENDEGVEGGVIEVDRLVEVVDRGGEIRTLYELHALVLRRCVVGLVVGEHVVVDALGSKLGVQFAWTAEVVVAVEVVDAIGDIAGLLDFCKEATGANGMDAACGQEEAVALVDGIAGNSIDDGFLADHPLVFVGGDVLFQSAKQRGLGLRGHEIPHLGFSALASLTMCYLVGGMHLNGQVVACIDELDEQRELVAKALVVGLAHQSLLLLCNEVVKVATCIGSTTDNGLITGHATDFPTLAYFTQRSLNVLERRNLRAAPDGVF